MQTEIYFLKGGWPLGVYVMYLKFLLFIVDAHSCAQALRHALRNPVLLTDAGLASRTRSTDNDNDTIDTMQYLKRAVSIIVHVYASSVNCMRYTVHACTCMCYTVHACALYVLYTIKFPIIIAFCLFPFYMYNAVSSRGL